MNCPYCLTPVADEALACPSCTKDLYLFKPMMQKVADLESRLTEIPEREALLQRVAQLEEMLTSGVLQSAGVSSTPFASSLKSFLFFLVAPLILLLLGHGLITIVYDTKLLYLRIISIVIPGMFGYALMIGQPHKVLPWFLMSALLAIASVFSMSYMTHLVDGSPVMPQNPFEWREFFEYGVSIAASFLTGMILGRTAYIKHNPLIKTVVGGAYSALIQSTGQKGVDAVGSLRLLKMINEHISTVVALGTTLLSVYTGLKGILG